MGRTEWIEAWEMGISTAQPLGEYARYIETRLTVAVFNFETNASVNFDFIWHKEHPKGLSYAVIHCCCVH